MKEVPGLHKEVVTGIVQVIKYLADLSKEEKPSVGFMELYKIGCGEKGEKSEEARTFIFEFIKDGVINLKLEAMKEVVDGNYDRVWKVTNDWLQGFGYAPVTSESIDV